MFCPRCGNQAASDRMRFCPACGFRLDGVIDLLARDGLPSNPHIVPQVQELSPRKRGIRRGAMLMFSSLVLFLPVLYFSLEIANNEFPLLMLSSVFIAGIFCMIYYRLFGEEYAPPPRPVQVTIPATQPQAYLAPQQSVPVYRSADDEPQRQQSVIENTTRTLGHE
jgi:hypothetical protein